VAPDWIAVMSTDCLGSLLSTQLAYYDMVQLKFRFFVRDASDFYPFDGKKIGFVKAEA
jgi:hypothetical protein